MKHKIDPENCEFLLDSENRIYGISFKLTEKKIRNILHDPKQFLWKYNTKTSAL